MLPLRHRGRGGGGLRSRHQPAATGVVSPSIIGRSFDSIGHLVLYNSGSVLNPREMPPEMLDEIVAFRPLACRPFVSSRSIRARLTSGPRFSDASFRLLVSGSSVRPILGIESADDRIRNEVLRKAMPRAAIIRVFRDLGTLAAEYGADRIGLDVNIVIAGPGTTTETAVDDAVRDGCVSPCEPDAEHGRERRPESAPVLYWSARVCAFSRSSALFARNDRSSSGGEIARLVRSMGAQSEHLHRLAGRGSRPANKNSVLSN